jgi:3-deoxy-manno-octulosonate cytidylyltransferase (CMP-KDO synthetase)
MENARNLPQNPVLLIPARLASTRLPNKILADIGGSPMILHVWQAAVNSGLGPVVVAAADKEIVDVVEKAGGRAVFTDPGLATGSDRIYEALKQIDPSKKYDSVVNVQGDLPTLDPNTIRAAFDLLKNPEADIGTPVVEIKTRQELEAPQVVKAIVRFQNGAKAAQAMAFTRNVGELPGPHYHHIGLYAYRRAALEDFVSAPRADAEKRESLEQLRALAIGLRIDAALVDTLPLGVDTLEDLEKARQLIKGARG